MRPSAGGEGASGKGEGASRDPSPRPGPGRCFTGEVFASEGDLPPGVLSGGRWAGGWGGGEGRGRPRAGRLLPIGSVGGVDADSADYSVSRRAAQTRRWPGASSAQLAARAGGQARPGQGRTPGVGHAPPERAPRGEVGAGGGLAF